MSVVERAVEMRYPEVRNYVGGAFVASEGELLDVTNPADGSVLSRVPLSTAADVDAAVAAAQKAFPAPCSTTTRASRRQ